MDKTYSKKKNKEQIATQIEKYKIKTFTKKIEDNNEFLEQQETELAKGKSKYKETVKSKWCFRILSIVIIIMFICGTIFIEMDRLKQNPESRDAAIKITNDFYNSMASFQDSWNTIYYFYQTGDLFNILNCRQNINKNHTGSSNEHDSLIVLYRDRIDKKINKNLLKDVSCGQKIYVNLEEKVDIEQSSSNNKELYSFVVGEEPIELLTKFPLLQYAIYKLKIGEKATFIARQQLSRKTKIKKQTIYNMEIIGQDNNLSNKLPPYIIYNENIGKLDIKLQTICNSNLNIKYTITDADENQLYASNIVKINIGSGLFNPAIEQILLKTHSHEEVKIFLTKKFYQPSKYLPENLFNNRELVIINIIIY